MATRSWTDEDLINVVKASKCYDDVFIKLGYSFRGGSSYKRIKNAIAELNLDVSHFKHNPNRVYKKISLEEMLVKDSKAGWTTVRNRLRECNIMGTYCFNCGLNEWCGEKLTLEIDHMNGDRKDNRLENLRLLCPNCHSQTPTYKSNSPKYKKFVEQRKLLQNKCVDCNKTIKATSTRCVMCNAKTKEKLKWPSDEILVNMVKEQGIKMVAKALHIKSVTLCNRFTTHGLWKYLKEQVNG